jgi:hypothetical protein
MSEFHRRRGEGGREGWRRNAMITCKYSYSTLPDILGDFSIGFLFVCKMLKCHLEGSIYSI